MSESVLIAPKEVAISKDAPHLSFSRINRYLHCPEQYRLYYIENLQPRYPAASLVFGKVVHKALARLFQTGEDPVPIFREQWQELEETELSYAKRDSWEKFANSGEALLAKFVDEELTRITNVEACEKVFELEVTSLDLPLVGVVDLVAEVDGKRTLVDFKTSGSTYKGHEARLSDQLTAYRLSEPSIDQAALCVLVRTKEPGVEWHLVQRSREQVLNYLRKAGLIAQQIQTGWFYKRPGMWCAWCDYLPVCLGEDELAELTLVREE